ncbi:hypothetical protein FB639_004371, partial [Coemansia asiatica]
MSLPEIARCMSVSRGWCYFLRNRAILWANVDMGGAMGNSDTTLDSRPEMGFNHLEADYNSNDSDNDGNNEQDTSVILLYDENLKTIARRAGSAMWRIALRFSPLISDTGIQALLDFRCVNLRHLEIRANRKISNAVLEELIKNTCSRLEYVALSTTEVRDHVIQQLLANAPNLVHLDLSFCRHITADTFPVANGSTFVFSSTTEPESDISEINTDSNQQSDMQTDSQRHDRPMFQVDEKALPRLCTLLLDGCVEVHNAVILRVLNAFGNSLSTLDLSRTKIT